MTHQVLPATLSTGPGPGRQLTQLFEALRLIEAIAGRPRPSHEYALDEAARLSTAYDAALPVVRRRFEALSQETALWAAAGVEALLAAGDAAPPRAAAVRLAGQLDSALKALAALLPRATPSP